MSFNVSSYHTKLNLLSPVCPNTSCWS